MPDQPVLTLLLGDVVTLRRAHPCGGSTWLVDRLGADIGLRCQTCGRHVLLERRVLEASDGRVRVARRCGDDRRHLDVAHAFRRPVRVTEAIAAREPDDEGNALAVFQNSGFLRLWLSQVTTQIGGNMVLFGLTVIVVDSTSSNTAVSLLILTFLVPAVLFSAVAGVYVDRIDRRLILIATNFLRGAAFVALYLAGANFAVILLLNIFVSTVTVFFAPAELAMIPTLVPRSQLLAANGIFTLTLNAAFAVGFALLGPLVVNLAGPEAVIVGRRRAVFPGRALLHHAAGLAATTAGRDRPAQPPRSRGCRKGRRIDVRPAARRVQLHPRQPVDRLVADLPGDHRLAGRRARRPRARLRQGDPRTRGQGLRGRRPAARVRDRDRDPAAQLVRPLLRRAGGSSRAA